MLHRVGGWGRTARYFPKVGTPKLQMVITNIITACASPSQGFFYQDYNSKLEFLKSHMATVHQNAVRLRTAKTIRYRIIRGGGGGFSLLRLTAIKQCWIDVLTF